MNPTVNRELTPRQTWGVIGTAALVFGAAILILCHATSCDERDAQRALDKYAPALGQLALDAYQQTRTDPALIDAYASGGWDAVKQAAPRVYLGHLKAEALELGVSSDKAERALYEVIREIDPDLALVVYRDGPLGPEGLWPWLENAAQSAGYPGASLSLIGQLKPEEYDWLLERLPLKTVEEVRAVRALRESGSLAAGGTGGSNTPAASQPSDARREDEEWQR